MPSRQFIEVLALGREAAYTWTRKRTGSTQDPCTSQPQQGAVAFRA